MSQANDGERRRIAPMEFSRLEKVAGEIRQTGALAAPAPGEARRHAQEQRDRAVDRAVQACLPPLREDMRSELTCFLLSGGHTHQIPEHARSWQAQQLRMSSFSQWVVSLDGPVFEDSRESLLDRLHITEGGQAAL